jgi:hypothetical protein
MRKSFFVLAGAVALSPSVTCVDTDPAVFVAAELDTPAMTVQASALGVALSGSFTLELHLGARASGTSEVTVGAFSLRTADQSEVLLESLPVASAQPAPYEVEPGSDVTVNFTIEPGGDTFPLELRDRLCGGPVVITGVIEDSLESGSSPVESPAFTPKCQ